LYFFLSSLNVCPCTLINRSLSSTPISLSCGHSAHIECLKTFHSIRNGNGHRNLLQSNHHNHNHSNNNSSPATITVHCPCCPIESTISSALFIEQPIPPTIFAVSSGSETFGQVTVEEVEEEEAEQQKQNEDVTMEESN